MEVILVFLATFPALCHESSLFKEGDGILELNETTFGPNVETTIKFWVIEFYKPRCNHCESLALEFLKIAHSLKHIVNLGAVDIMANTGLKTRFQIQGVPTIKIFGLDKNTPINYSGRRDACPIIESTMDYLKYAQKSILMDEECENSNG